MGSTPLRLLPSWRTKIRHLLSAKESLSLWGLRVKPAMTVNGWSVNFIALIATLLFTSCEKEIEFRGEQTDPKLVINSLVAVGQPVKAYVSKSYFFLDDEGNTQTPEDVVVSLYVNDDFKGTMQPSIDTLWSTSWMIDDEGNYTHSYRLATVYGHDYLPEVGDVVSITASANGYDDAQGTTSVLPRAAECQMDVEVTGWDVWYQQVYNYDTYQYEDDSVPCASGNLMLTFTITDPNQGKTDCFRLVNSRQNPISFYYDDPLFEAGMLENDFIDASDLDTRPEGVFTDALFDGGSYRLHVEAYYHQRFDDGVIPDVVRVPVLLEHLSKEYYNYLYTRNQGEEFMQIWAEPIQTFSNVNGGYGIVAGNAVTTLWVELPTGE